MKWYSKYLLAYEKTFAEVPPTIVEAVAILRLVKSKQTFFHKEEENV